MYKSFDIGRVNVFFSRVRVVEDMIPPITTVAKGRWTSAPVPVAKAIGINPKEAT